MEELYVENAILKQIIMEVEMEEKTCEHEFILNSEEWMSEQSVMATAECQKCKAKFRGLMIKQ